MNTLDTLDPRPIGWFAIAFSREIPRGRAKHGVLATAPYVVRRGTDGSLAHEGPMSALVEQDGIVLAWHCPSGTPPSFTVPALTCHGYRPARTRLLRVRSHPQETFENSIDLAHFPKIHGYTGIEVLEPMRCAGPRLVVRYRITRAHPLPFVRARIAPSFEVRLHGIGVAHNHVELPWGDLRARMMVFSTPTEPGYIEIRLSVALSEARSALVRALGPLVARGVMHGIAHDFAQDVVVWESKRFVRPPVLAPGDGPIGAFRQWCKQFYETPPSAADSRGEFA